MSIRPIDFQVMIPKTSEVSKIHNDQAQRNVASQQQQAASVQHKADSDISQVYSQDRTNPGRIREKQEKGHENRKDGKKEQNEKKSARNSKETVLGRISTIDIRL